MGTAKERRERESTLARCSAQAARHCILSRTDLDGGVQVSVDAKGALQSQPAVCVPCRTRRVELESAVALEFSRGTVFVERRKAGCLGVDADAADAAQDPAADVPKATAEEPDDDGSVGDFLMDDDDDDDDKDNNDDDVESSTSRAGSSAGAHGSAGNDAYRPAAGGDEVASASSGSRQTRTRSQRASKGRHRFMVSSTTTLGAFKVQLMNKIAERN